MVVGLLDLPTQYYGNDSPSLRGKFNSLLDGTHPPIKQRYVISKLNNVKKDISKSQ